MRREMDLLSLTSLKNDILFSLPGRTLRESAPGFSYEKLQHTKQVSKLEEEKTYSHPDHSICHNSKLACLLMISMLNV